MLHDVRKAAQRNPSRFFNGFLTNAQAIRTRLTREKFTDRGYRFRTDKDGATSADFQPEPIQVLSGVVRGVSSHQGLCVARGLIWLVTRLLRGAVVSACRGAFWDGARGGDSGDLFNGCGRLEAIRRYLRYTILEL